MTPTPTDDPSGDSSSADDPWLSRLRDADRKSDALAELREYLFRGLRKAFRGQGGGESFAEDVTQEALITILEKLDQFAGRSRFTTWAMSIAVRIGTHKFRRKHFQDVSLDDLTSGQNLEFDLRDADAAAPEQRTDREQLLAALRRVIDEQLTDRQREATDAILHGMPVEVIAERIGSNRNAVYKLIHDARMKLKAGLEAIGYTANDIAIAFD